jgi:hypothetical protein
MKDELSPRQIRILEELGLDTNRYNKITLSDTIRILSGHCVLYAQCNDGRISASIDYDDFGIEHTGDTALEATYLILCHLLARGDIASGYIWKRSSFQRQQNDKNE